MVRKKLLALTTTAFMGVSLLGALPAQALMYSFAFTDVATGGSTVTASGLFNVTPSGGNFLINSMTGTYNGDTITGLLPVNAYLSNDNMLLSGPQQLSFAGFSFSTASFGSFNIYNTGSGGAYGCTPGDCLATEARNANNTNINLNFSASPVPIPAAVWLFGSGLIGLVGIGRRRRAA